MHEFAYSRKNGYTNRILKILDQHFFDNLYNFLGIHYIISTEFPSDENKGKYTNFVFEKLYNTKVPIWNLVYNKYNLSSKEVTFQLKRLTKIYKSIDLNEGYIILSYEYLSFLISKTLIYRSESKNDNQNAITTKPKTKTEQWKKSVFTSILKRNGFKMSRAGKKTILTSDKDNIEIIIDENMSVTVTNNSRNKI